MKDFITQKLERFLRKQKYTFWQIKKLLKEDGIALDKIALYKRLKK